MAIARSTSRARAWKWSVAGGSIAAFLAMAQVFHVGDASRPSTPVAASASTAVTQQAQAYGGATLVCVAGAYGYSCSPVAGQGRVATSAYGGAFAHTRSSGS